jgi:hypothetical protein
VGKERKFRTVEKREAVTHVRLNDAKSPMDLLTPISGDGQKMTESDTPDEGALSRLLIETTILLAASRTNAATVLRDAATVYKVDTDAITLKVKQEFVAKAKAKKEAKPVPKPRKAA